MHGSYHKIVAHTLSTNFREATRIVTATLPATLRPSELLVRNRVVGINASDINFTAGVYQPDVRPPFDCGFEALGEVVAVGAAVHDCAPGDVVVTQSHGSFAEFQVVGRRHAKRVPSLQKEWLPLDLSGTTAAIALEQVLKPRKGEIALVTAAAGGTGQFAVQLLKHVYGCTVIGTCSGPIKAAFVKSLGCDHVIDVADGIDAMDAALRTHCPTGVHLVYEGVGGATLDAVVRGLALRGRVLSIGGVSTYRDADAAGPARSLPLRLLSRSATLHTFFLPHFVKHAGRHFAELCALRERGVLQSHVDPTPFHGLSAVYAAIDHLYSRRGCGKIVVEL